MATFRTALFLSIAVFLCCVRGYSQSTINVPGDQPTIQAGINAAVNGDTVLVADGHYHEHINFNGKNITVTSANGPELTIIDGDVGNGPVVRIISSEGREAVLNGFTIEHGSLCCFPYEGGGVEVDHASPTVTGNIITSNSGPGRGGGVNVYFGGPLIDSNTVRSNTVAFSGGTEGGGISVIAHVIPLAQITNNTITGNFGVGMGGGIDLNGAGPVIVQDNLITDNRANYEGGGINAVNDGGAIIVQNLITGNFGTSAIYNLEPINSAGFTLINNTIANNYGFNTVAVVIADGFNANAVIENNIIVTTGAEKGLLCNPGFHVGPPAVRFNDVFSSQGVDIAYAGECAGFSGTNGNISADPLFASVPDDFHLLSDSPVIDVGDNSAPSLPELDFDGSPRIVDATGTGTPIIDMGVYEFQVDDSRGYSHVLRSKPWRVK